MGTWTEVALIQKKFGVFLCILLYAYTFYIARALQNNL